MRTVRVLAVFLLTLAGGAAVAAAQTADSTRRRACGDLKAALAVQEALATNLAINRFDAWVLREEWAKADFKSWSDNLRLGWEWDENAFQTNMFGHPFHGSLYFNSGRSNCLTYWESVPLAFLGSFTWEFFGETYRPSLNDFFMTTFGGIALGEMTHRVGATIRNNEIRGAGRVAREIGAMIFDPMGGINRLFRGEWGRIGPNPAEHDPGAFFFRLNAGVRGLSLASDTTSETIRPTIMADLGYGDPFERDYTEPFDVFTVRAQVTPGGGGINLLRASGRLYQRNLPGWGSRSRLKFVINQRYDYRNNPVYSFGMQSFEFGLSSRFGLPRLFNLRFKLTADAAVMGAIDAPFSGVGERTYDFGPGLGSTLEFVLERRGVTYLTWHNRGEFIHSVSGATANHVVSLSDVEITIPIRRGLGIGIYSSSDGRFSKYDDGSKNSNRFLEGRIFLSWTSAREVPR